ncbi:MAG: ABC transporter substrate-binding protein [Candidatus Eisenbacteria bacterium]|uniref:ABC transporter substrate-binding protein n=1 Tax=Eiseniibacteriota bacterium TaxID=2212470 RepID=A0A948W541_UNCEI|nr:ABC transporter substrate-binding protein [Candidatus Eisenbacteria bacterium]MBU1950666.1 ABC transporter substrate-binding protein [Candidatus Eisenbacteria bacterium]MBU2689635.1 ABC transporter substrate-binding protein [Candidatus Eisenbacteria bacterium]
MNKSILGAISRSAIRVVPALVMLLSITSLEAQVKVGILAPLNGPDAPVGVALANGVDLALSYQARSRHADVSLFVEDTSGGEAEAIQKALNLLDQNDVDLLLGEIWSSRTLAVAGVARARDVLMISPVASDPAVGRVGQGIYSLAVSRIRQMERLLVYAKESLEVKRPALFYSDAEDGRALRDIVTDIWISLGMPSPRRFAYTPGQHDFVQDVEEALSGGADAIIALGSSRETLSLVSHASQKGFLGPYLGLETLGTDENIHLLQERLCLAAYADDSYAVTLPGGENPDAFDQVYRQQFGTAADRFARHGFLSMLLLYQIISSSGESIEALEGGLENLRDPMEPGRKRVLNPPETMARVQLISIEGGVVKSVW